MTYGRAVRRIFAWEFRRFLKLREILVSIVVIAAFGLIGSWVVGLVTGGSEVELAVVEGPEALAGSERFELVPMTEAEAQGALSGGEVDGVLLFEGADEATLLVGREPGWAEELDAYLAQALLPQRLEAAGISEEALTRVGRPVIGALETSGAAEVARGSTLVSILLGLMIFAIFTGAGLLFTTITGEKTQRVTELVVSAVPPQAWIDGKVLGTIAYVVVNLVTFAVGIGIAVLVPMLLRDGPLPPLPPIGVDPVLLAGILPLVVLGAVLYLYLYAAVAASIDDPATSQRSGMLMVPGVLVALGWLGLIGDPSSPMFVFLSYFPLTSASAMSVRLLLGDAGTLELLLSLAVLAASSLAARWAAGKVFSVAVLITGKEPTWGEMLRWLRRAA